ncbi:MAG: HAD superfamily hydrolase (TIGR01509 family) [Myxococcota bacterium]|jgi:HAD superfamily hydrolase (TIGR01509 family)
MTQPTLIFDMDGVLVDSEVIANAVFAEHLRRHGAPITDEAATELFRGRRLDDCFALVDEHYKISLPSDFLAVMQAETFERLRAELKPVRHVEWALETLRPLQSCLASSSEPDKITLSLEVTGLDRFFPPERRFSGAQVPRGKPHPDLFLLAADTLEVAPRDCLVIEDSPAGVAAARRARMTPLGYAERGHNMDALVEQGGITFSDMRSLPAMINGVWTNLQRYR